MRLQLFAIIIFIFGLISKIKCSTLKFGYLYAFTKGSTREFNNFAAFGEVPSDFTYAQMEKLNRHMEKFLVAYQKGLSDPFKRAPSFVTKPDPVWVATNSEKYQIALCGDLSDFFQLFRAYMINEAPQKGLWKLVRFYDIPMAPMFSRYESAPNKPFSLKISRPLFYSITIFDLTSQQILALPAQNKPTASQIDLIKKNWPGSEFINRSIYMINAQKNPASGPVGKPDSVTKTDSNDEDGIKNDSSKPVIIQPATDSKEIITPDTTVNPIIKGEVVSKPEETISVSTLDIPYSDVSTPASKPPSSNSESFYDNGPIVTIKSDSDLDKLFVFENTQNGTSSTIPSTEAPKNSEASNQTLITEIHTNQPFEPNSQSNSTVTLPGEVIVVSSKNEAPLDASQTINNLHIDTDTVDQPPFILEPTQTTKESESDVVAVDKELKLNENDNVNHPIIEDDDGKDQIPICIDSNIPIQPKDESNDDMINSNENTQICIPVLPDESRLNPDQLYIEDLIPIDPRIPDPEEIQNESASVVNNPTSPTHDETQNEIPVEAKTDNSEVISGNKPTDEIAEIQNEITSASAIDVSFENSEEKPDSGNGSNISIIDPAESSETSANPHEESSSIYDEHKGEIEHASINESDNGNVAHINNAEEIPSINSSPQADDTQTESGHQSSTNPIDNSKEQTPPESINEPVSTVTDSQETIHSSIENNPIENQVTDPTNEMLLTQMPDESQQLPIPNDEVDNNAKISVIDSEKNENETNPDLVPEYPDESLLKPDVPVDVVPELPDESRLQPDVPEYPDESLLKPDVPVDVVPELPDESRLQPPIIIPPLPPVDPVKINDEMDSDHKDENNEEPLRELPDESRLQPPNVIVPLPPVDLVKIDDKMDNSNIEDSHLDPEIRTHSDSGSPVRQLITDSEFNDDLLVDDSAESEFSNERSIDNYEYLDKIEELIKDLPNSGEESKSDQSADSNSKSSSSIPESLDSKTSENSSTSSNGLSDASNIYNNADDDNINVHEDENDIIENHKEVERPSLISDDNNNNHHNNTNNDPIVEGDAPSYYENIDNERIKSDGNSLISGSSDSKSDSTRSRHNSLDAKSSNRSRQNSIDSKSDSSESIVSDSKEEISDDGAIESKTEPEDGKTQDSNNDSDPKNENNPSSPKNENTPSDPPEEKQVDDSSDGKTIGNDPQPEVPPNSDDKHIKLPKCCKRFRIRGSFNILRRKQLETTNMDLEGDIEVDTICICGIS